MDYQYYVRYHKKDILTIFTDLFNLDIANLIYKEYDKIVNTSENRNKNFHIYFQGILKPKSSMFETSTHLFPYFKNLVFKSHHEYDKHFKFIKYKKQALMMINIIGHSDFVSKTNEDLKNKNCKSIIKYLYINENTENFFRDVNIFINTPKCNTTIWEKIKIVEKILKIAEYLEYGINTKWEGDWNFTIYELLYNNYLCYKDLNNLYSPGYICDKNNIIYGF